ncbi:MAG: PTS system mannose/fructose/sorbose family transporter subunit IID [Gemmatimonadota bacterium]|nr:MAG: PTS system mannose/fructose/sorbose family transporter subunit IID [Gemmatimonadota bacterium]
MNAASIRKSDWIHIFFRSFYIQAAWNYPRMLALGFANSMAQIINRICRTKEERVDFLLRHLEFFNAHPYFASFVLGAAIHVEDGRRNDKSERVRKIKNGLCGPLGSLGDQFFWNGLRPLAGIVGAVIALRGSLWGPIVFLAVYNLPHLWVRYWGLRRGFELGPRVFSELVRPLYKKSIRSIRVLGAIAVGFFLSVECVSSFQVSISYLVLFLLFIIYYWVALKRRVSLFFVIPVALIIGFITAYIRCSL